MGFSVSELGQLEPISATKFTSASGSKPLSWIDSDRLGRSHARKKVVTYDIVCDFDIAASLAELAAIWIHQDWHMGEDWRLPSECSI